MCENHPVKNNFIEFLSRWILKVRYISIIKISKKIKVKVITRLAQKKIFVKQWKDGQFSLKSDTLYDEFLKISQLCRMSGNGDNGYVVTKGEDKHIVNLKEKKCTCRTWNLTEISYLHAINVM